ncbi:nuclear transport factor 2 family protein [Actinomadura sp. B10D3]|uniref:nuclear transport factor 2 family protein n=1 Tax=Actinomadura sp. B10D3 TaxID=3153557 RepID=UPI00325D5B02
MTGITGTGRTEASTKRAADGVIAELLGRWQKAFGNRWTADLASLFTEDALFQGISPRLLVGPAEIFGYYDNVAEGSTARVQILGATWLGDRIVGGFADVTFTARTGETFPIRLSVVAQHFEDTWRICQYHAAAR